MQCPEEELDTVGKRKFGAGVQPVDSPGQEILGCDLNCRDDYEKYKFSINKCESHVKSDLDTILNVNTRDEKKLKFLIDTGAEISIIKGSSLNSGVNYQLRKSVEIKGICDVVLKTGGIVELKLLTDGHETANTFHVLGEPSALQYDILGRDFLEEKESVINYCSRQIIMNDEVIVNFEEKPCVGETEPCRLTLKAISEYIVNVPTNYKVLGVLDKTELSPGFFLAASLTRGKNGVCATSVVNTTELDQMVVLPQVDLENLS